MTAQHFNYCNMKLYSFSKLCPLTLDDKEKGKLNHLPPKRQEIFTKMRFTISLHIFLTTPARCIIFLLNYDWFTIIDGLRK